MLAPVVVLWVALGGALGAVLRHAAGADATASATVMVSTVRRI